jgi:hypothetical protein
MLLCFFSLSDNDDNYRCIKASMVEYRMCCCGHWSKKVVLLPLSCHHSGRWGRVGLMDGFLVSSDLITNAFRICLLVCHVKQMMWIYMHDETLLNFESIDLDSSEIIGLC